MEALVNIAAPDRAQVRLSGSINEDADVKLRMLLEQLAPYPFLEFDLAEVASIDSLGVRAWVHFLRGLREKAKMILLHRCSPDIISQVNMIPSFAQGAVIKSFFANYVCPSCDHLEKKLFETASIRPGTYPPGFDCPRCHSAVMETEELEDEYFAFLSKTA